jgi:hypothetical protein
LKGCDDASLDLLAGFASSFARLPFEGISGLLDLVNEGCVVHASGNITIPFGGAGTAELALGRVL